MINITLRQLRAFVAVARTGSFTLAAESLFVTQSALSGLIKELEQLLGLRLFDRSTRRIHLTDTGRQIYPLIAKTLNDLDGVIEEVTHLKALKKGSVRIAAPQLMACTLMPEVIAAYRLAHPDIDIRLIDCAVESVTSRVFSGEVDIGVGPERDPNSDIIASELFTLPFVAVLPPDHALCQQASVRWADLVGYPLITLQGQFTERLSAELHAALREFDIDPNNTVTFMSTALSMVASGLGVTVCIPYASSLVRLYQLETRPLTGPTVERRFYTFSRNGRALSPAAQSFVDFLYRFVREQVLKAHH